MKTKKNIAASPIVDPSTNGPTHEQIALRARRIWKEEGRPEGRDMIHWQQAEAELRQEAKAAR
jgi:hypothetical protein